MWVDVHIFTQSCRKQQHSIITFKTSLTFLVTVICKGMGDWGIQMCSKFGRFTVKELG